MWQCGRTENEIYIALYALSHRNNYKDKNALREHRRDPCLQRQRVFTQKRWSQFLVGCAKLPPEEVVEEVMMDSWRSWEPTQEIARNRCKNTWNEMWLLSVSSCLIRKCDWASFFLLLCRSQSRLFLLASYDLWFVQETRYRSEGMRGACATLLAGASRWLYCNYRIAIFI